MLIANRPLPTAASLSRVAANGATINALAGLTRVSVYAALMGRKDARIAHAVTAQRRYLRNAARFEVAARRAAL